MSKIIEINGETVPIQEQQILKFQDEIERRVGETEISYIEAISEYCEEMSIDYESIGSLLSGYLIAKITKEARARNLVPNMPDSLF